MTSQLTWLPALHAGNVPIALDALRCLHAWSTDHSGMGAPCVTIVRLHAQFPSLHEALFRFLASEASGGCALWGCRGIQSNLSLVVMLRSGWGSTWLAALQGHPTGGFRDARAVLRFERASQWCQPEMDTWGFRAGRATGHVGI